MDVCTGFELGRVKGRVSEKDPFSEIKQPIPMQNYSTDTRNLEF